VYEGEVTRAQIERVASFNRRMEPPRVEWCAGWPRRSLVDLLPWLALAAPWGLVLFGLVLR
jgi:hypothetical protein